jgi:hypothetical protein
VPAEGCYSAHYRKFHNFPKPLETDALANLLGTGTLACPRSKGRHRTNTGVL